MLPMTQHLGQLPGRARLGAAACGHRDPGVGQARAVVAGSWRPVFTAAVAPAFAVMSNAAMGYMGATNTTGLGCRSIKRTTRHLATRST